MTPEMLPMKRCGGCGEVRRDHDFVRERVICRDGADYHPVTMEWAGFQRSEMERAEAIYDRCPNIECASGLPVPFEDAMPQTRQRCIDQAKVEFWTGAQDWETGR